MSVHPAPCSGFIYLIFLLKLVGPGLARKCLPPGSWPVLYTPRVPLILLVAVRQGHPRMYDIGHGPLCRPWCGPAAWYFYTPLLDWIPISAAELVIQCRLGAWPYARGTVRHPPVHACVLERNISLDRDLPEYRRKVPLCSALAADGASGRPLPVSRAYWSARFLLAWTVYLGQGGPAARPLWGSDPGTAITGLLPIGYWYVALRPSWAMACILPMTRPCTA